MRLRIKWNERTPIVQDLVDFCYLDGRSPQCSLGYTTIDSDSRVENFLAMADIVTPDFRRRSAAGEVIISPMISEEYHLKLKKGKFVANYYFQGIPDYKGSSWVGDYSNLMSVYLRDKRDYPEVIEQLLSPYSGERDIALTQAYANVDESELLLYASLGESPETIKWLASIYSRAIGVLKAVKNRQVKVYLKYALHSKADVAEGIADTWMEARYALRPLLFEAEQLVAAFNVGMKPKRKTARGKHFVTENFDISHVNGTGNGTYTWDTSGYSRRESYYRAGVLYQIDSLDTNWIDILGFDKPLETIWELTKLSFALDWLFNIGDKLASFTPSANLTPLGCWVKETHVFERQIYTNNINRIITEAGWTKVKTSNDYGFVEERHVITRRIARPELSVFPSIKINLNWAKCVDLAMIARQIYRALRRP